MRANRPRNACAPECEEWQYCIHPILVGSGKRLFEEGREQTMLELVDSKTFSTGVLYLTYRPA
jgi:dihydrofolate reductase